MVKGTGIEQVGDNWYYWVDAWTGTKGPFATLPEAAQALEKELQDKYGKEKSTHSNYLIEDKDNV